jgi:hypothetical protein
MKVSGSAKAGCGTPDDRPIVEGKGASSNTSTYYARVTTSVYADSIVRLSSNVYVVMDTNLVP